MITFEVAWCAADNHTTQPWRAGMGKKRTKKRKVKPREGKVPLEEKLPNVERKKSMEETEK